MDEVVAVRGGEGIEDLGKSVQGIGDAESPLGQEAIAKVGSVNVFHREVARAIVDALVIHPDKSGVCEPRGSASFPAKAGDEVPTLRSVSQVRVHDFERDLAFEAAIDSKVDGRHPAASDPRNDLVSTVDESSDERISHSGTHGPESTAQDGANV